MAITPWKPFSDIDRILREEFQIGEPALDLYETDKKVIAELSLPKLDPEKTQISIKDNVLRIKGSMEEKKEEKGEDYLRREIKRGYFERMITLPSPVKKETAEATYEKGILKIEMEKEEETEGEKQKIQIKIK